MSARDQQWLKSSVAAVELWEVAEMSGNQFDRGYSQLELQDHLQDLEETTTEVQQGSNPQIRHDARQEIPMLQLHLHLSRVAFPGRRWRRRLEQRLRRGLGFQPHFL